MSNFNKVAVILRNLQGTQVPTCSVKFSALSSAGQTISKSLSCGLPCGNLWSHLVENYVYKTGVNSKF